MAKQMGPLHIYLSSDTYICVTIPDKRNKSTFLIVVFLLTPSLIPGGRERPPMRDVHVASKDDIPTGSVHKSRGDRVVYAVQQVYTINKTMCVLVFCLVIHVNVD